MVDDDSTLEYLGEQLEGYVKQIPMKIRIIRGIARSGLIQAKEFGARHATVTKLLLRNQ